MPVLAANPNLPPQVDEIIRKALEKDRELRYQTVGELRADLKRLKRDSSPTPVVAVSSRKPAAATTAKPATAASKNTRWLAGLFAVLCIVITGEVGMLIHKHNAASSMAADSVANPPAESQAPAMPAPPASTTARTTAAAPVATAPAAMPPKTASATKIKPSPATQPKPSAAVSKAPAAAAAPASAATRVSANMAAAPVKEIKAVGGFGKIFGAQNENMGRIYIHTVPKGARVLVGAQPVNHTTPVEFDLAPGKYSLTLSLDGYPTAQKQIIVEAGKKLEFTVELTKR
jgi:hypothetical protein